MIESIMEINLKGPIALDRSITQMDQEHPHNLFEEDSLNILDQHFPEGLNLSHQSSKTLNYHINEKQSEKAAEEIDKFLDNLLIENAQLGPVGFHVLLALYILVICIGTLGNVIVLIAISCKKSMRTPHNFFIASLAVSGMLPVMLYFHHSFKCL